MISVGHTHRYQFGLKKKIKIKQVKSPSPESRVPETGSDPPFGSDRESGRDRYHIETMNEGNIECIYITSIVYGKKLIMEKLSAYSSKLYHINIKSIESYVVMNQKFNDSKTFSLWHERLGHPKS